MRETKYVFFSTLGGSDPISGFHDASMLHICRVYKPVHICLYMSAEILEHHRHDDRYCKCIRSLYREAGQDVTIEIIERPNLTNPHVYDQFYDDFREILNRLHREHPDCQLITNVSSGTPAMKTELRFVSSVSTFRVQPIQVNSYTSGQTPHEDPRIDFDFEVNWECNEDNKPDFDERAHPVNNENLLAVFAKDSIIRFARSYDYRAARVEAEQIRDFLSDELFALLNAAEQRMQLVPNALEHNLGAVKARKIINSRPGNIMPVIEYIAWLDIKQKRGDLFDFIRGITPALYRLSRFYAEKKLGISLMNYCTAPNQNSGEKLIRSKLEKDPIGQKCLGILDAMYSEPYQDKYISSDICIAIINGWGEPVEQNVADLLNRLRKSVEEKIRNNVAHDITALNEEILKRKIGMNSTQIMKLIKEASACILKMDSYDFESYDRLNECIRQSMDIIPL
ncbi:MAG: hypothetical protein IJL87_09455 [Clostridia bacterium]|nr:hypothetical protein [Clostridia bacterium]